MSRLAPTRCRRGFLAAAIFFAAFPERPARAADAPTDPRVEELMHQLGDADARDAAQRQLVELALDGNDADAAKLLERLTQAGRIAPQNVRRRLTRIVDEIRAQRAARRMVASRVTLDVKDAKLPDVLAQLERQTGNRLSDYRQELGQRATPKKLTLRVEDEPFWSAVDRVLDAAQLSPYPLSGEEPLALVEREPGVLRRFGRAVYSGPFRIEATGVVVERGLRLPEQSSLQLELEVAWEPRLHPLALTLRASGLTAVCDDELPTPVLGQIAFNADVTPGSHAVDVAIPLQLPSRKAMFIRRLHAKMKALVPGQLVELKFGELATAKEASQESGGVRVTLEEVVKNGDLWEVHMRVQWDDPRAELASHGSWLYQNATYLLDNQGQKFEHAGFETTALGDREAGFLYLFEIPGDIADYAWAYRTPTAIESVPVEFELTDVPLP